jgi:hypothetical protein
MAGEAIEIRRVPKIAKPMPAFPAGTRRRGKRTTEALTPKVIALRAAGTGNHPTAQRHGRRCCLVATVRCDSVAVYRNCTGSIRRQGRAILRDSQHNSFVKRREATEISIGEHCLLCGNGHERGDLFYDLLRGDEPYKAHWRATPRPSYDATVVPSRASARLRFQFSSVAGNVQKLLKSSRRFAENLING